MSTLSINDGRRCIHQVSKGHGDEFLYYCKMDGGLCFLEQDLECDMREEEDA